MTWYPYSKQSLFTHHASRITSYVTFLFLWVSASQAALYNSTYASGFANSGNIPDANPTGWADTRTLTGITDFSMSDVSVSLNAAGGYNGDLYAYLSYNGVLVPLLNRVGVAASSPSSSFGYSNPGLNITLSDSAANDVHFYGRNNPNFNGNGQLIGNWQADGRNINPNSSPASFDSANRVTFGSYDNLNPNGSWTLFIADMAAGDQSQVLSWSLNIEAVPEPVNAALAIFGGLSVSLWVWKRLRVRQAAEI